MAAGDGREQGTDEVFQGRGCAAVGGRLGEATLPGGGSAAKAARWGHAVLPGEVVVP